MSKSKTKNAAKTKFQKIEDEMNEFFIERRNVIRGLLVALLSEQNVVFIGPPGTSKSMMVKELSLRLRGDSDEDYFEWLMTKFSKPEEIMGPMMIEELIKGTVKFNPAYKLPKAKIAYLDEVFKANSSILNSLLTALNEKVVYNDNKPMDIPLQMLVGTSNEIPSDESLKALYDRFRIRFETEYIKEPQHLKSLLDLDYSEIKREGTFSLSDLDEARKQINFVSFPDEKKEILCKIIYSLDNIKCRPSDRTINQVTKILKAECWMNGKIEIDESDMEFLEHCFWEEPKRRKEIRSTILGIVNPLADNVLETYEKVHMSYLNFLKEIKDCEKKSEKNQIISSVCGTMMTLKDEMEKDVQTMRDEKRPVAKYESLINSVTLLIAEIKTEHIGKLPDIHKK